MDLRFRSHSSISGDASRRGDVVKMALFLDNQLISYGVETKLVDLGEHTLEGQQLKLPPAILGKIGTDPKKKTVLIYGHFDVQPVSVRAVDRLVLSIWYIPRTTSLPPS